MAESVFALPVSVEQVAAVIKQMGQAEQRHLLELVPDFRALVSQASGRTKEEAQERVAQLREKVISSVKNEPLSPDDAFLGDLTLRQYHALSEKEKAALWEQWADTDLMESDEREVGCIRQKKLRHKKFSQSESQLAKLYAEASQEDRLLAEEEMAEYAEGLRKDEDSIN